MTHKKDAPGMRGYRTRNEDGRLRDKRDDTHMGIIEKLYGKKFNVRGNMRLGNYLKKYKMKSLKNLITRH